MLIKFDIIQFYIYELHQGKLSYILDGTKERIGL